MAGRIKQEKTLTTTDFEILCYETDEGAICLEFGESAICFSKKRFLEFADKLNHVRESVLLEFLQSQKSNDALFVNSYRI